MEDAKISPQLKKTLQELGIVNPEVLTTKQASSYLTQIKNIPTAARTLEVWRHFSRGPVFKRIGRRCYYTVAWLDQWAHGVEVKIFDPTQNSHRRAA